jgi:L-amino acid N-acyltransferase YncA
LPNSCNASRHVRKQDSADDLREFLLIRQAVPTDAAAVAYLYNHYVRNTIITFEEEPVATADMAKRIMDTATDLLPWLVLEEDRAIIGYARASKWKPRSAYRFSVETTIYLTPDRQKAGIGTRLYGSLISELKNLKHHTAIGGIALRNSASVALHEKLGFRKVAHFVEVGFKFGRWIDVAYWQIQL